MIAEIESAKSNAQKVRALPPPQVPTLFFTSNGNGTGIKTKEWRKISSEFPRAGKHQSANNSQL
jgi:hypothetical protein